MSTVFLIDPAQPSQSLSGGGTFVITLKAKDYSVSDSPKAGDLKLTLDVDGKFAGQNDLTMYQFETTLNGLDNLHEWLTDVFQMRKEDQTSALPTFPNKLQVGFRQGNLKKEGEEDAYQSSFELFIEGDFNNGSTDGPENKFRFQVFTKHTREPATDGFHTEKCVKFSWIDKKTHGVEISPSSLVETFDQGTADAIKQKFRIGLHVSTLTVIHQVRTGDDDPKTRTCVKVTQHDFPDKPLLQIYRDVPASGDEEAKKTGTKTLVRFDMNDGRDEDHPNKWSGELKLFTAGVDVTTEKLYVQYFNNLQAGEDVKASFLTHFAGKDGKPQKFDVTCKVSAEPTAEELNGKFHWDEQWDAPLDDAKPQPEPVDDGNASPPAEQAE